MTDAQLLRFSIAFACAAWCYIGPIRSYRRYRLIDRLATIRDSLSEDHRELPILKLMIEFVDEYGSVPVWAFCDPRKQITSQGPAAEGLTAICRDARFGFMSIGFRLASAFRCNLPRPSVSGFMHVVPAALSARTASA